MTRVGRSQVDDASRRLSADASPWRSNNWPCAPAGSVGASAHVGRWPTRWCRMSGTGTISIPAWGEESARGRSAISPPTAAGRRRRVGQLPSWAQPSTLAGAPSDRGRRPQQSGRPTRRRGRLLGDPAPKSSNGPEETKPMSDQVAHQTLAAFVVDNGDAARRLLKAVQRVDQVDGNVQIVDAAVVDRTRFGRVKVHQTTDRGALKAGSGRHAWRGRRGDHRRTRGCRRHGRGRRHPRGLARWHPRHRHRRQVHATGLEGDREEEECPVPPVRGQLGRVDRACRAGDHRRTRAAVQQHAAGRQGRRAAGPRRAGRRGTRRRGGGRGLRARGR